MLLWHFKPICTQYCTRYLCCAAGVPVLFVHGRHDLVAMPEFGKQMAAEFAAPFVYVDGAHFTPRENAVEVRLSCQRKFCQWHVCQFMWCDTGVRCHVISYLVTHQNMLVIYLILLSNEGNLFLKTVSSTRVLRLLSRMYCILYYVLEVSCAR